jgi:hypothetical protein
VVPDDKAQYIQDNIVIMLSATPRPLANIAGMLMSTVPAVMSTVPAVVSAVSGTMSTVPVVMSTVLAVMSAVPALTLLQYSTT